MTSRFWACDFQILKGGSHDFLAQKVSASTVFNEARGKDWRERLLRSSRRKPTITTDGREPLTQEERNEAREEEERQDGYNEEENRNHQNDVETERQHNRRQEPPRRQLPQRTRRPPPKLKDYIVGFKNRETEL